MIDNIEKKELSNSSMKELITILSYWFNFLLRKWGLIVSFSILTGSLGYLITSYKKPIYTATLTYALGEENGTSGGGLSGAFGLASSMGIDLGINPGGAFGGANLAELMHSRSLIEKTLLSPVIIDGKKTLLVELYIDIVNIRSSLEKKFNRINKPIFPLEIKRENCERFQDSLLSNICNTINKSYLTISNKEKKMSIGTVEVKSNNEVFSKLFCEKLVQEVSDFYVQSKSKKAQTNVFILGKQVDSVRAELNNAITGVANANDNIYNLNSALNVKRAPSSIRQVDVQANTAILTQLVINLELAKVALRKETPLFQIIDKPIFPLPVKKESKGLAFLLWAAFGGFLVGVLLISKKVLQDILK